MSIHADWPFVTVHWQPSFAAVHMEWHRPPSSRGYQVAMETGLRLLERQGAGGWLDDCRHLEGLSETDRHWYTEDFVPRAGSVGLRSLAIIPSEDDVLAPWVTKPGCVPEESPMANVRQPQVAFFVRPLEAMLWLRRAGKNSGRIAVTPGIDPVVDHLMRLAP